MKTRCLPCIALSLLAFLGISLPCVAHPLDVWYPRFTNSPVTSFYSVTYGGGNFVAVGASGAIARSTNGNFWTVTNPTTQILRDVTYGSGKFVAVGDSGTILTSTNAINWEDHSPGTNIALQKVCFGNSRYVALGYTTSPAFTYSLVSMDGMAWSHHQIVSNYVMFGSILTFNNGLFVYPRFKTNLLSADGISWWSQPSGLTSSLYMIGAGANTLVAFDINSLTFTSHDATNWTFRGMNSLLRPEGLAYGNGHWVAVSRGRSAKYSSDLISWTSVTNVKTTTVGTCFGNGSFITVASFICQSAPLIWLQPAPGLPGAISISGPAGVTNEIQALNTLGGSNWQTLATLAVTNSPYLWIDPDAGDHPQKFYRVVLP